jgi:hypothetical protein
MGDMEQLKKLREPFPPEQIGKLPKGGALLDFVGHGFLTQRLLDVDPLWTWEPLGVDENGLPRFDEFGGLWIKLTVCGVTRLGYGDAGGRKGSNAVKEIIGDALRNAGMRFGMALELWSKGDPDAPPPPRAPSPADEARDRLLAVVTKHGLNSKQVAARFAKDYGGPLLRANAATIDGFAKIIDDENTENPAVES